MFRPKFAITSTVLFLFLFFSNSFAAETERRSCYQHSQYDDFQRFDCWADISLEKVIQLKEQHPEIRTKAEFLHLLKKKFPVFFEYYVLMHSSRSLQVADLANPRVIHFGSKNSFYLAYGNLPNIDGKETIEMMEYNEKEGDFTFFELQFSNNEILSRKNPTECLGCHTKDQHPLWDPYAFWPGAFDVRDNSHPIGEAARIGFKEFVRLSAHHPIYKNLVDVSHYFRLGAGRLFANTLSRVNNDFILKKLMKMSHIDKKKYAILGALKQCDLRNFFPTEIWQSAIFSDYFGREVVGYNSLHKSQEVALKMNFRDIVEASKKHSKVEPGESGNNYFENVDNLNFAQVKAKDIANLRFVTEFDGSSIESWFFASGDFDYRNPRSASFGYLISGIGANAFTAGIGLSQLTCTEAAKLSLEALGSSF